MLFDMEKSSITGTDCTKYKEKAIRIFATDAQRYGESIIYTGAIAFRPCVYLSE